MASRKSSASYTKAGNIDSAANSDILLFQGNRMVHPDRQPKIPPPVERQKDEGFARFLKKHASPTHNRVTAGGRIVPMEPRSPPVFALPSAAVSRPQAVHEPQGFQAAGRDGMHHEEKGFENRHPYEAAEWRSGYAARAVQTATARPVMEPNATPVFIPSQAANNLMHTHMYPEYTIEPPVIPMRNYFPEQQLGGPVMPQHMHGPPVMYSPYYSPSTAGSALPVSHDFGRSPAWSGFDHNFGRQEVNPSMMPTYELLVAWEQLYFDLDVQLKNIDRHRAMHQLDPYLAEQRKQIVQKRSDAKDVIKECQMLLGLRRMTDSSQDSFATSFNVDAPSYVPSRLFDSVEPQSCAQLSEPAQNSTGTDKPKGNSARRAIPIISPPKPDQKETDRQPATTQQTTVQDLDVDEWGVQNRPAPPEIHREQSRMSDMLQAEQRRSASVQDDISQNGRDSQTSVESQQGVTTSQALAVVNTSDNLGSDTDLPSAPEQLPKDNADEMQQVMNAIGKPKGTTTRVRLLDNRVIDVEGQGLSLSAIEHPPRSGRNGSIKAGNQRLTPSTSYAKISQDSRKHATNLDQTVPAGRYVCGLNSQP